MSEQLVTDNIVQNVIDKYNKRSKIQTTIKGNNTDNYLVHLQEELINASLYIEKLLVQIKEIKPKQEKIEIVEVKTFKQILDIYKDSGEYMLEYLYSQGDINIYTEESLRKVAIMFLNHFSSKGYSSASKRKTAIPSMKKWMSKDLNPTEDWQKTILKKKEVFCGWDNLTLEKLKYYRDNYIHSPSTSKFYKEQIAPVITSEQKELLQNVRLRLDNISEYEATQILHGVDIIK